MNNKLLIAVISLLFAGIVNGQNVTITASLDSAYILMGNQTKMHIEIVEDNDVTGESDFFKEGRDTVTDKIEIIKQFAPDTIDLGNNRRQINRDYIIQSFDSGLYTIPAIQYNVNGVKVKSNSLALKVIPVSVDSLATIHEQANVISPNHRWYDFLPDFITDYWYWLLLAIFIIAAAVVAFLMVKKDVPLPLMPKKKIIPPYELAKMELAALKEAKLCEKSMEKEYYTRLTDILRVYVDSRFGINAMEMTSSQIIDALNNNAETKEPSKFMKQILEIADFVKFAKVRPMPEDNIKSFNWATQFVEDTKPVVEENATTENNEQKQ